MKKFIILPALFLLTLSSCSQDFDKTKMDSLFSTIERNQKGMGSISIFKNGNEVYQKAYGYADLEDSIRATAKTKYRIGSISKSFTSSIIMQLIEENKLNLDTRLADFFPEIPNANKITVEQLLRHRSGLYNFTNSEDYPNWMEESKTKPELIKIFVDNGTVFNPDEKAEYSNTNYVLLSYIAEKIEKKEFADILNDRILIPAKLNNTYYGGEINPENHEAFSYTHFNHWELATETDMDIPVVQEP